jgi:hypothetical protein
VGALSVSYGQTAIEPTRGSSYWVNNVAGAIAGPFVLVIVAGVLFVVMLVGVVPVFAMMLLVVSKFVEAKC